MNGANLEEADGVERRRLDRILVEGYLGDLQIRSTDEIRRMRDECEEEEGGISYARRILQAKLDIIRAEAVRRRDGVDGNGSVAGLLDALPAILGDDVVARPLRTRAPRFLVPPNVQYHRREVDTLVDETVLTTIAERSTEELTQVASELTGRERQLSTVRRALLDRIDALQEELVARYKGGRADVAEVLPRRA